MPPQKVKTKIVCTIGPSTSSRGTLVKLIEAGMNVARLNLSHGDQLEHAGTIQRIRMAAKKAGTPIGLLVDLPGRKIRIGRVSPEPLVLRRGQKVILTDQDARDIGTVIPVQEPSVLRGLVKGDDIFIADGSVKLIVERAFGRKVICRVVRGGTLLSGKGINLPGKSLPFKGLTARDVRLLQFALREGADFIGLSFIETAKDVLRAKNIIEHFKAHTKLIAKIESRLGFERFDEILDICDGVMVARGDLGVELPIEEIPIIQKRIIAKANTAGKPVITATQMLESMVDHPTPTRAEVTDIATAVMDGTDALMLSEETAVGKYPIEAVTVMRKVTEAIETELIHQTPLSTESSNLKMNFQDAVSLSACIIAKATAARCIVTATRTGRTASRVSKFRPSVPLIALTESESVMRQLTMLWGVYPMKVRRLASTREIFGEAKVAAVKSTIAKKRDTIVVIGGTPSSAKGTTDLVAVQVV